MSDTQIRMRFSQTGLKQIRDDLKASGQEGSAAFQKIGESVDSPNKALGLTVRELQQVKAAADAAGNSASQAMRQVDRQLSTASRLNVASTAPLQPRTAGVLDEGGSAIKSRINASTGVSGEMYSAAASAAAFEALEKRASALRDVLNPTAAAERTFSKAVGESSELLAAGAISEAEHTAAVALAKKEFSAAGHAAGELAEGVSLNRMQMMELGHVARSAADGLAAGQNPMRILAMEAPRVGQALSEGSGGLTGLFSKLGAVIRGPIGMIGGFVTVLLTAATAEHTYAESQEQLQRSLLGAGRASGATAAQLEKVAETSGRAGNVSTAAARQMEVAFLSTGKIGTEQIAGLISIARDYSAAMGVNAKQATQELAQAFASPSHGADELNEKLHFLSDATREEIRNLEDSGQRAQAQTVLLRELAGATDGAAAHFGTLTSTLHDLAEGFANAWNWGGRLLNRLTSMPTATKVADIDARIAALNAQKGSEETGVGDSPVANGTAFAIAAQIADLQKQRAALQKAIDAPGNEVSTRAGDVARANNPFIRRREDLEDQLKQARAEADRGFKDVTAEVAAELKRDILAIPRALATLPANPEAARVQEATLRAQLAKRPGSAERSRIQAQIEQIKTEGQVLTPGEASAETGAAAEQGYNRGLRVDQAGERRGEAAARKAAEAAKEAAAAQREWDAAKTESLGVDHNLTDAENKLTDLRLRGAKISDTDAKAYLASASAKDAAAAVGKANEAAKANREWEQALSGVSHESTNLDRALDLIAKRTQDVAANMKGAVLPTAAETAELIAQAKAADRAAEASKALDAAKSAVKEATSNVSGSLPEPKTTAGHYDSTAAIQQWNNARAAIYAEAEQFIRAAQAARVSSGEISEMQAAENTARGIAAIDAAYSLQSASEVLAIRKKAADDVIHYEEEQQQALNSRIASDAQDFGSAVMKLTTGAKLGNVGRDLAKQLLEQILETLVSDPLVALIKQELQALTSPQAAGAGGALGLLSGGLRTLLGATGVGPITATPNLASAYPSLANLSQAGAISGLDASVPNITITPPGYASGTNSTPSGLRWVGESGPELEYGSGQSIMSASKSAGWIKDLQQQAFHGGAASGGSPGDVNLHYNPMIHMDATGADPAQLKRTQDAVSAYQRQEPAHIAAYLKAAKLR